jgi:hypothetical protein
MSGKIKTIKLSYPTPNWARDFDPKAPGAEPNVYTILQVTDSIEFSPKQQLRKAQVESLCASREWKVTIVPPPPKI